ncbi:MAG: DNA-binding response regulator [Proteobacteria bacterium]|nr:MAG: DNA-binding response regulator [Pseudomonadota bacterium]
MAKRVEILIVDDHLVVREGLKRVLDDCDVCMVAAEASNVTEALAWLHKRVFDLVLLDLSLPEKTGLDLLRAIKKDLPKLPVLVLSAYREDHYAVRALKEGADGYLNKESAADSLIAAVLKVAAGGKYLTPALAERLLLDVSKQADAPLHASLSDREFEVMKLIARGQSLKRVGEHLRISPKTVTTYRARIIQKTGLENNAALTRYMLENNLLD